MEAHDHIQHRVARALGISRTTLDKWLRELGISRPKDIPREAIEAALQQSGGDIELMARELKISVRGLKLRMTELGMGEPRRLHPSTPRRGRPRRPWSLVSRPPGNEHLVVRAPPWQGSFPC
jgi:DNA-binding NtrC family response regulator